MIPTASPRRPLSRLGVLLVVGLAGFIVLYRALGLPDQAELQALAERLYAHYGYLTVVLAALLESLFVIGIYLPGSLVLIVAIALAQRGVLNPSITVLLIWISFFFTCVLNYCIGKYGLYRLFLRLGFSNNLEAAKRRLLRRGLGVIFWTNYHPNLASMTATAAGVLRLAPGRFLLFSAVALAAWILIETLAILRFPNVALLLMDMRIALAVILIAVLVTLIRERRRKEKPT